jgi:MFS family permease
MLLVFLKTTGWLIIPVLILAGLFGLSSQPITLAIVQDQLPMHRSIGNGLFMGINFICLSLAAIGIGMLADRYGLRRAFLWTAISGLLVTPLVLLLPRAPRTNDHKQPAIME